MGPASAPDSRKVGLALGDALVVGGLAVALGMDAFAAAIAVGAQLEYLGRRHVFRLAFHFGLFQFLMPLIGWIVGETAVSRVAFIDHWIVFGLLLWIGGRMVLEALRHDREAKEADAPADPTRGWSLVTLSVATSLDALAAGLSLSVLQVTVWASAAIIGVVAGLMTWTGMRLGRRVGDKVGKWAEVLGGIILLAIGAKILVTHLAA